MTELVDTLTDDDWEIKSVIPLTSSEYFTEGLSNTSGPFSGSWGGGYGYGAPYTDGVVVICQRATEVSVEEINCRQQAREDKKSRQVAAQKAADVIRLEPISALNKGLFKADTFLYDGIEYLTHDEAVAKREAKASAAQKID